MNVILLGSIIKSMGLTDINWEAIISQNVKEQFKEINIKALNAGMNAV
jgi:indolepyruvate ferredoxin oxidoreductase beta subunit